MIFPRFHILFTFSYIFVETEEEELQRIPGRFDSVEEYISVFEPLLFEECRAQLYSTWEESSETVTNQVRVCIKSIERRERGTVLILQLCLILNLSITSCSSVFKLHADVIRAQ